MSDETIKYSHETGIIAPLQEKIIYTEALDELCIPDDHGMHGINAEIMRAVMQKAYNLGVMDASSKLTMNHTECELAAYGFTAAAIQSIKKRLNCSKEAAREIVLENYPQ